MGANDLVFNSKMEEIKDLLVSSHFNINQVLDLVNIVLVPFKSEAFYWVGSSHLIEDHGVFLPFEHLGVQKVVDLLIVQLEERDVDRNSAFMLDGIDSLD